MRSTFDIDEKLLEQARKLGEVRTKRDAVELALREFVRSKRLQRLQQSIGTDRLNMTLKELARLRRPD